MDLNYILKRIIIGTGIALAIMFIKDEVFAATNVSQYQYRVIYNQAVCVHPFPDDYTCIDLPGSTTQTSSFISFGTAFTGANYNISGYYVRMGTPSSPASDQFQANMSCTTTFTINYNPRDNETSSSQEWIPTFNYFNGTDYVEIPGTYSVTKANDDYGYNVTFNYQPPAQSRYIYVQLDLPSKIGRAASEAVNFRNGKTVCATSSTDNAILDGTAQIKDAIADFKSAMTTGFVIDESLQNLGNVPDPYTSSGLSNLESQVNWDVGNGVFDIDLSPFATPFSFIWLQVESFLDLDPILLKFLFAILVLSFVALVVGR